VNAAALLDWYARVRRPLPWRRRAEAGLVRDGLAVRRSDGALALP
jgi:adenine-specific DNA glycosylase